MIVITGAFGYIGSMLVDVLSDEELLLIDKYMYMTNESWIINTIKKNNIMYIKSDVLNVTLDIFKNANAIINLAAYVGENICNKVSKEELYNTNVYSAVKLAKIASQFEIPFIQMSTCSNYGIKDNIVDEDSLLEPTNRYAESKVMAETLTKVYPSTIIIRGATVYGLSHRMRFDLILNEWVKDAYFTNTINVYNPYAYRPLIHVKDMCNAIRHILLLALNNRLEYNIINVGSVNYQKIEIAKSISRYLDVKVMIKESSSDKRNYRVSFDRLRRLGFNTLYTLDDGILEVLEYLKNNPHKKEEIEQYANI